MIRFIKDYIKLMFPHFHDWTHDGPYRRVCKKCGETQFLGYSKHGSGKWK
jgi:hypothetical protein